MFSRKSVLPAVAVLAASILGITLAMPEARAAAIEFVTGELPWAALDKPYAPAPLEVRTGGTCPLGGIGFAVISGALPPGIAFSRLGYFSGTATLPGAYDLTIRAANGCSWIARRFTIIVSQAPVFTIKPERVTFQAVVGEGAPPEQILRVSATWPRLPYEITITGGDWVKALPDQGRTPSDANETRGAPGATGGDEKSSPSGATNKNGAGGVKKKKRTSSTAAAAEKNGKTGPPAPPVIAEKAAPNPGDAVHVRIDASGLQRGYYSATITFSAWQAAPTSVLIELAVLSK
jgi:hypothetical protein